MSSAFFLDVEVWIRYDDFPCTVQDVSGTKEAQRTARIVRVADPFCRSSS